MRKCSERTSATPEESVWLHRRSGFKGGESKDDLMKSCILTIGISLVSGNTH